MLTIPITHLWGHDVAVGDVLISAFCDAVVVERITKITHMPDGAGVVTAEAERTIVYPWGEVRSTQERCRAWGTGGRIRVLAFDL